MKNYTFVTIFVEEQLNVIIMHPFYEMTFNSVCPRISTPSEVSMIDTLLEENEVYTANFLGDKVVGFDWFTEDIHEFASEYVLCDRFDPQIVRSCFALGYYPLSIEKICYNSRERNDFAEKDAPIRDIMTIRHHKEKLILTAENFHVPGKTRRYIRNGFSNYKLYFNRDFTKTLRMLRLCYSEETWLCRGLCDAFISVHVSPDSQVSLNSVEIYNEKDEIVAGEIGFITGNSYASLSGFHKEDNIGTVQMAVLGKYLFSNGFKYWDLGMDLPYKHRYNPELCDRKRQREMYETLRCERINLSEKPIKLSSFL